MEHRTKKCTRCGQVKSIEDFYVDRRNRDGRTSECRDCRRAYNREHHRQHKQRVEDMMGADGMTCKVCGVVGDMDLHHVSEDKTEQLSNMRSASDVDVKTELAKTIPLCHSCHKSLHMILARLTGSQRPLSASDTERAINELLYDREMRDLGFKWCPRCRSYQPRSAFYANIRNSDGLDTICKACKSAYKTDRRRKRKQALIEERTGYNII